MPHIIGDLDDLITTIHHAARGESRTKQTEAERQAEKTLAEARQQAERTRQEILDRARAQAEAKRRQLLAGAVLTARHNYLTGREELLNQVWQRAEQHLRSLPDEADTYADVLGQLARLAVHTLGPGQLILAADPKGHDLLTEERLETWSQEASDAFEAPVSFERAARPADTWGGLVVTAAKGRRGVDATFPARLEMAKDEIREMIFKRLVQET